MHTRATTQAVQTTHMTGTSSLHNPSFPRAFYVSRNTQHAPRETTPKNRLVECHQRDERPRPQSYLAHPRNAGALAHPGESAPPKRMHRSRQNRLAENVVQGVCVTRRVGLSRRFLLLVTPTLSSSRLRARREDRVTVSEDALNEIS